MEKPFKTQELWACLSKHLPAGAGHGSFKPVQAAPVDRVAGLKQSLHDENLYLRIISDFLGNNITAVARFQKAAETGEMEEAYRIIHSLKSASAMIGASALAKAAHDIETALDGIRNELDRVLDDFGFTLMMSGG